MSKVNVLGTEYTIIEKKVEEDEILKTADGYIDKTTKVIVLLELAKDNCEIKNVDWYKRKVLRHEIIHAFFYESGLAESSNSVDSWAMNEEMVDFFAYQFPKILKAFKEVDCL